jgi:ribonucleotide monophosphatase NagD (HAD superfamily)
MHREDLLVGSGTTGTLHASTGQLKLVDRNVFVLVAAIDCEAVRHEGFVEAKHESEILTTTCIVCHLMRTTTMTRCSRVVQFFLADRVSFFITA